jgi:chaperone modulatory protein CbpM
MKNERILVGVLIEETTSITFKEVCLKYNISNELLIEMIEHGLLSPQSARIEHTQLNLKDLHRIESAFRLHKDLGVNLQGVALALDLLEEVEELRKELDILRRHF